MSWKHVESDKARQTRKRAIEAAKDQMMSAESELMAMEAEMKASVGKPIDADLLMGWRRAMGALERASSKLESLGV